MKTKQNIVKPCELSLYGKAILKLFKEINKYYIIKCDFRLFSIELTH